MTKDEAVKGQHVTRNGRHGIIVDRFIEREDEVIKVKFDDNKYRETYRVGPDFSGLRLLTVETPCV